jgi:hypothetical protein
MAPHNFRRTSPPHPLAGIPLPHLEHGSFPLRQNHNPPQNRKDSLTRSQHNTNLGGNAPGPINPLEPLLVGSHPLKHLQQDQYVRHPSQESRHATIHTLKSPGSARDSQIGQHSTIASPYGYPPDDIRELTEYLQAQFQNPSNADILIVLYLKSGPNFETPFPAHSLLASRSPVLKRAIDSAKGNDKRGQEKRIQVETNDCFIRPDAFGLALWRLYGGNLLSFEDFSVNAHLSRSPPSLQLDKIAAEHQLKFVLAYAAAGNFLQIPSVSERALYLLGLMINWSTIERIFDFVLEGGLSSKWLDENQPNRSTRHANKDGPALDSSSSHTTILHDTPTYGTLADALLHELLDFAIHEFPMPFKLDISALENGLTPSHTSTEQPTRGTHKSKPGFIQFGDIENDGSEADQTTIILSKVLLSLPFHVLKTILESTVLGNVDGWISPAMRRQVMESVISEREARRLAAIEAIHTRPEQSTDNLALEQLGWKESVITSEALGHLPTLHQEWIRLTS